MRTSLGAAIAVPLMLLIQGDRASAQDYPWCAEGGFKDGARSCGFVTREQCLAAVSGVGGFCERNPTYRPRDESSPASRRSRR
jgi:hypothetical protein